MPVRKINDQNVAIEKIRVRSGSWNFLNSKNAWRRLVNDLRGKTALAQGKAKLAFLTSFFADVHTCVFTRSFCIFRTAFSSALFSY